MFSRNWEDWAMAVPLVAAAVVALALSGARAPSFAMAATAAETPRYLMNVTGKRLPAECKGLTGRVPAHCAVLMNSVTVTVREVR